MKITNNIGVRVEKNSFIDEGDGVIRFNNGLTITDDTVQKNGTRYDIPTMSFDEYNGNLTANHSGNIQDVVGKVMGIAKRANRVAVDAIQFAINENPLARFAYNMIKGGYLTDFSIETYGEPPTEEGVYFNAKLVGLSTIVVGNNNNAAINSLVHETIDSAKKDGMDTTEFENKYLTQFSVVMNHTEEKEPEMAKVEAPVEEQDQVEEVEAPAEDAQPEPAGEADNAILEQLKVMNAKIETMEKNAFDKAAKEPEFTPAKNVAVTKVKNELEGMDWRARASAQINAAWEMLKLNSRSAGDKLRSINEFHLDGLKQDGKVMNSMTIADFGNFVISREQLSEIEGFRSNYMPIISATTWRETLSTQMAWLKRSGDVDMTEVEFCDDGADGNLKPVSEYTANILTSNLSELAAVTPVCNAATRFLAADLLGDVNQGYRTDYDRKRAQLVIARLEQAVELNGNSVVYNTTTNTAALQSWLETLGEVVEVAQNGTFIFNYSTYVQLLNRIIGAGITGPLSQIFTTGDQAQLLGRPYIVVPNDLMPTLNSATTTSIVVDGATVTVNHAVFYADLSTFTGRTSGGLQYDLSTDAAYEVSGTVYSAFQRNELVLRGSFFRGGAVRDTDKVAGLRAPGVS